MFLRNLIVPFARKIRDLDNSLWKKVDEAELKPGRTFYSEGLPFSHHSLEHLPNAVASAFKISNQTLQYESIWEIKQKVRIDPSRAWAILPGGKLFWKSIPFSEVDLPPRPWFTKYSFLKKKVTRVPALISSRYWIHNYFHFYNDFLGSLELLERKNIPLEIPIIVPKFIFDGPLFKSIQTRSRHLKKRPLLIQSPSEYFETEYALFPKVMPNRRLLFDWVLDDLGVTIPTVSANKKIYIIRSAAATRGIKNAKEIETIAASEGFTCVETGKLTANEQEKLFAEATHVVAVHGAGLLNIIFRRAQPMSVLEIFPEGFIPPHYYWLSKEYGYRYEALVAGAEIKGNFHLDPTTFRKALKNLIGTASAI